MRLLIIFLLLTEFVFGQTEVYEYPPSDSIVLDIYKNRTRQKDFYKNGKIVLSVSYKIDETYGTLDTPFWSGPAKEDSCMFFTSNGKYSIYYFASNYFYKESFSDHSNIFSYSKRTISTQKILEKGQYYIHYDYSSGKYHSPRYKMGTWELYDTLKNITISIDYDKLTINEQPIKFENKYSIVDRLKVKSDSLIANSYGAKFSKKYIRFNLDKSTYGISLTYMRPEQPSGIKLLNESKYNVEYIDFCYDIVLNDTLKFDLIMIRIDKDGNIIGERRFDNYLSPIHNLCVGLTNLSRNRINAAVYKYKEIARKNGFKPNDKDFVYRMEWNHTKGLIGEIKFVMEQPYEIIEDDTSKTTKFRQLYIDPWTGKKLLKETNGRVEEIIMERGH